MTTLPEADDTKPAAPWKDEGAPESGPKHPQTEAKPGALVGRYTVLEKVGAGGMGVVYRAEDPELRRDVALKVLRPRRAFGKQAEQHRARLLREARAMAKLAHPNVIRVYDVGMHGDGMFVAMEFVAGEDARRWMRRERPGWRRVLGVYRAAGRGLAAAHAAGMVHRDFKPANVHVGDDGRVRVLDFGLARAVEIEPSDDGEADDGFEWSPRVTRAGSVVGTPVYMAPEQFSGLPPDPRSDQYAFCISLYESLFGVPPFPGRTPRQIARAKLEMEMEAPPSDSEVPAALIKVIERGLEVEPSRRFPGMPDVLRALRGIAEAPDGEPKARWRWPTWAVTGGAATLAIGAWLAASVFAAAGSPCDAGANADIASHRRAYFDAVAEREAHRAAEAAIVLAERWSALQCGSKASEWADHARAQLRAAGSPAPLEARLAGLGS